jgi:hypothetical protein
MASVSYAPILAIEREQLHRLVDEKRMNTGMALDYFPTSAIEIFTMRSIDVGISIRVFSLVFLLLRSQIALCKL